MGTEYTYVYLQEDVLRVESGVFRQKASLMAAARPASDNEMRNEMELKRGFALLKYDEDGVWLESVQRIQHFQSVFSTRLYA